jgi:hypothetical protein
MKIIITENQNYIIRRLQQFIDIVEEQIEGYEQYDDNSSWWCHGNTPFTFYENVRDRCIEEFTNENWDFFHDDSEKGGANMDLKVLYRIVSENYGNYIKNLFVRKCGRQY